MAQQTRESGDEALAPVYGILRKWQNFRTNSYFIMQKSFFFKKRIAQSIDYLWERMLPREAQTVQYRFLRRLYGNRKSPLSCRSSGSCQNIFETIGAIGTVKWKPGLTISSYCCKTIAIPNKN